MLERIYCDSAVDAERLIGEGFAIVAIAGFQSEGSFTFVLERGSAWSRLLGSR